MATRMDIKRDSFTPVAFITWIRWQHAPMAIAYGLWQTQGATPDIAMTSHPIDGEAIKVIIREGFPLSILIHQDIPIQARWNNDSLLAAAEVVLAVITIHNIDMVADREEVSYDGGWSMLADTTFSDAGPIGTMAHGVVIHEQERYKFTYTWALRRYKDIHTQFDFIGYHHQE
ncbi:predicted protein [Lichtheimia corymbifera JMRC:FSU:9682]|uniref:Uncharacterized protein n=1 Tax=Lichtheimia corymbifera JMRC:FSU:9682 TaxID=1263082 RepID=A0A068SII9_9FUNG|nr:predicted protein [Lichtheimia corymbifera JMRC:FSU:9682]